MKEKTQEKLLMQANENSIFYKIKRFFRNLFHKEKIIVNTSLIEKEVEIENKKSSFIESIKNIEDEETKLLKLQKQYRSGEIKEEDLTQEQIKALCDLYDKQIDKLRKENKIIKQKLLEYKKTLNRLKHKK